MLQYCSGEFPPCLVSLQVRLPIMTVCVVILRDVQMVGLLGRGELSIVERFPKWLRSPLNLTAINCHCYQQNLLLYSVDMKTGND